MRLYLKTLVDANEIDVKEEFQQACFHLSVYKKYVGEMFLHSALQVRIAH